MKNLEKTKKTKGIKVYKLEVPDFILVDNFETSIVAENNLKDILMDKVLNMFFMYGTKIIQVVLSKLTVKLLSSKLVS